MDYCFILKTLDRVDCVVTYLDSVLCHIMSFFGGLDHSCSD